MSKVAHLGLFEGYGIEIEYMIVDRDSLAIRPEADRVLAALAGGSPEQEVALGEECWSNELALHVIELKTNGPKADLAAIQAGFQRRLEELDELLSGWGAMLLPTAMHPFLDPSKGIALWPHGDREIYETYDRIFSCNGHGWSNLQSIHVNLPFKDDDEFGRLHAAVRAALPLLPALAAASPVVEGRFTGALDNRLLFYRGNQKKIPEITGHCVPEPAFTKAEYDALILQPMYRAIAPYDPAGILQDEWLNSRGAIARWDRHAIEIRVLDSQESAAADLSLVSAVVSLVRALAEGVFGNDAALRSLETEALSELFWRAVEQGGAATIDYPDLARIFGTRPTETLQELWQRVGAKTIQAGYPLAAYQEDFRVFLEGGSLAQRIEKAVANGASLEEVYQRIGRCLIRGERFRP